MDKDDDFDLECEKLDDDETPTEMAERIEKEIAEEKGD